MKPKPTFDDLLPELRRSLAQYIIESRRKDRGIASGKGWISQTRGADEYFFCLGIMPSYLEAWISRRMATESLVVLEAGMGQGVFCQKLLDHFGESLMIEGLRLTYSANLKGRKSLRQRIGLLESISLTNRYDLVISARGPFVYSLNSFAAVEGVLNAMKSGAIAYVDDAKLLLSKQWFRQFLGNQGIEIEVTRYERGIPYAYKMTKLDDRRIDLSPFARRYIEGLNAHEETIRSLGFDRTPKRSPLTKLLSSLYEDALYKNILLDKGKIVSRVNMGENKKFGSRSAEIVEVAGVIYVNDAYSQCVTDLLEAMEAWKGHRVLWISGGEKALSLARLGRDQLPIYGALFFGEGRFELAEAWKHLESCLTGQELKNVTEKAFHIAKPGDVVLFSPGLPPNLEVHGSCENRAADFSRCIGELRNLAAWTRS